MTDTQVASTETVTKMPWEKDEPEKGHPIMSAITSPENDQDGLDAASPVTHTPTPPAAILPPSYIEKHNGLYYRDASKPDDPDIFLAGPLQFLAETRDVDGNAWGILLYWRDHDDHEHR